MNTAPSHLEIRVHGPDGRVAAFVQEDAEAAQRLIEQLHPGRLFTQPVLAVAGRRSLTLFPSRAVVRLDLVFEGFPDWPFPRVVPDVLEVNEEEFRQRVAHPQAAAVEPGLTTVFAEVELTNGCRVFLELHVSPEPRMPVDFEMLVQQYLSAPSQYARRRGGGVIVLNPEHFLRLQLYPGPPAAPPGAWAVAAP